jgi:hypothetical protein
MGSETHMTTTLDAWIGGSSAQVSPSNYYTPRGSSITFTGTSFAPNEQVNLSFNNGADMAHVTADANGSFTLPYTIPLSATTAHFVFTGASSNLSSTVDVTLAQFYSGITLSTYWAQGGSALTINGSGFGAGEEVDFSTSAGQFGMITADTNGSFIFNGAVPYGPSGDVTLTARGAITGASATSPFTIAPLYTGISLSNYAGTPGTNITVSGGGYVANDVIAITSDRTGSTVLGTVSSDSSGNVTGTLQVPNVTEGNLTLTFTGEHSFDSKQITIYVIGQ